MGLAACCGSGAGVNSWEPLVCSAAAGAASAEERRLEAFSEPADLAVLGLELGFVGTPVAVPGAGFFA